MSCCKLSCGAPQAQFEQERAQAEAANAAARAAAGLPATDAAAGPPPAQSADAGAKAGPSGSGELRNCIEYALPLAEHVAYGGPDEVAATGLREPSYRGLHRLM